MLIIYGHNMNGGSMFAALQGYLDAQYRENHPVIRCDSLTGAREYMEYVRRVQRDALYDTGLDAAWGQQLLALSTCDRRNNNARIMVIARSMEG